MIQPYKVYGSKSSKDASMLYKTISCPITKAIESKMVNTAMTLQMLGFIFKYQTH